MLWLSRWLTMAPWLMWFLVYWGVGTRSYIPDDPSGEARDHRQRPVRHRPPSHLHSDAGVLPGNDVGALCLVDVGAVDGLVGRLRTEGAGRGALLGPSSRCCV